LRRPRLLLLDEATSALDAESERMVQAALDAALHGGEPATQHAGDRASALDGTEADRIVVLEGGQVVEQGRHEDLMARGGVYARFASMQLLS
jgi:ATP-binding cassette subfamily B protein